MSVGRNHGANNQEGTLTPQHSAWGQRMILGTPQLIDDPMPIGRRVFGLPGYGGTVGGLVTVAASIAPIVSSQGYFGDAPESLQGQVGAADPWNRP